MGGKMKKALALLLALCLCLLSLGAADDMGEEPTDGDMDGTFEEIPDEIPDETPDETPGEAPIGGEPLHKALAALSQDPVALMELSKIRITTSAEHCVIRDYTWYDANHNVYSGDTFGTDKCRVEIVVAAAEGYYFAEDVAGYINNSSECSLTRDASGAYVTLAKDYTPAIWAPTVIFDPKAATVNAGEHASFWASGLYAAGYDWYLKGPKGEKVSIDELKEQFPEASATENGKDYLTINKIPAEMNGWSVVCTFVSAKGMAKVDSKAAKITVNAVMTTPDPNPSPNPDAPPDPEATPDPAEEAQNPAAPETTEAPGEHEHEFSEDWSFDKDGHWHACACGERRDGTGHRFIRTDEEGRRVCEDCGYTEEPEAEPSDPAGEENPANAEEIQGLRFLRWLLIFVAAGIVIGIVLMLIQSVRESRRRRRRRRRR